MQTNLTTPVLLTIWNRPDAIRRIMHVLEKVKPPVLFLVADAGRSKAEQKVINQSIKLAESANWNCQIKKFYPVVNLGPRLCVSQGISTFFSLYDRGIILEHDCLPNESFFYFCQELLDKYAFNHKIMHISGNNFNIFPEKSDSSYYFSTIPHIWGFATWKRAWELYDVNMKCFGVFKKRKLIKNIFSNIFHQRYWMRIFNKCFQGNIDTWDFQWTFTVMNKNGLCITPRKNLVTNIGFGKLAANMKDDSHPFSSLPLESIDSVVHPSEINWCKKCDSLTMKQNFDISFYSEVVRPVCQRLLGMILYVINRDNYNKIRYS